MLPSISVDGMAIVLLLSVGDMIPNILLVLLSIVFAATVDHDHLKFSCMSLWVCINDHDKLTSLNHQHHDIPLQHCQEICITPRQSE